MKLSIRFYNDHEVRAVWSEEASKWYFSVLDIIGAINEQDDYAKTRNYWKYLKAKLKKEDNELVSVTTQLKLKAADGKKYNTDVLDAEGVATLAKSMPTNPMLATPMYLAGYIERMGTGTTDVVDACTNAGLGIPKFEQDENFRATIWRKNVGQNVTQNVPQSDTNNQDFTKNVPQNVTQNVPQNVGQSKKALRYIKIMNTLLTNRRTPLREIAEVLGVSEKTVKRDLNVIRQSYRIEWIGSPKTGRWEIEKL